MTVLAFASPRSSAQRPLAGVARPCAVAAVDAPSDAAVEEALTRIVGSATFRHSQRHRAFLSYLVRATLDGLAQTLKEVVIGLEVFNRRMSGYDPDRDSIVRVEAKRMRAKLARYYASEGADDAVEIGLPVGRYVPQFRKREPVSRTPACGPLILVLPFVAFSGDLGGPAAGIATALADRIAERLGEDGGLRLIASNAGPAWRERPADVDAFVRAHGVDYVVDGMLGAHGPRVRCVAHLSRMRDRIRPWSCRLDFARDDADASVDWLAAQDRVADELGVAVRRIVADDVVDALPVRRRSIDHR